MQSIKAAKNTQKNVNHTEGIFMYCCASRT